MMGRSWNRKPARYGKWRLIDRRSDLRTRRLTDRRGVKVGVLARRNEHVRRPHAAGGSTISVCSADVGDRGSAAACPGPPLRQEHTDKRATDQQQPDDRNCEEPKVEPSSHALLLDIESYRAGSARFDGSTIVPWDNGKLAADRLVMDAAIPHRLAAACAWRWRASRCSSLLEVDGHRSPGS
jgi:hypothetical protein